MKTKLFTQKSFFVMLTLVLAFGVQGIADALTFRESRTGDLQTIVNGNEFTVSFSVTLGGNTTAIRDANGKLIKDSTTTGGAANARIDSSGYLVVEINGREYRTIPDGLTPPTGGTFVIDPRPTYDDGTPSAAGSPTPPYYVDSSRNVVDSTGAPVYVQTGTGVRADSSPWRYTRAKADPNDKVPDLNRYHYNEEAISIAVPTGATLTKVGTSYRVNVAGGSTHTMNELKGSVEAAKLTSSIRLTFRATTVGERTITITDTTADADRDTTLTKVPLSFTIFVVPARDTTALTLTGDATDGYEERNDYADPQVNTLFNSGDNVPLVYSVVGSGRLYVEKTYDDGSPTSKSSSTQTLSTSSAAVVKLDMNGSSNKVTAYVRDTNAAEDSKTIYFIFQYAQIEIVGGNNKTGVPNARLINPLHIRVKDAKGRALSGLAVTFTPASDQGSTLQPVIGTDVYLTNPPTDNSWASAFGNDVKPFTATATVPADPAENAAALVPTDRSGEAEVYLKLGGAGNKTVAVSAGGDTDTFYVTSSTSTAIPSLEIFSGNNQKSASDGKVADPLVVQVLASSDSPLPVKTVTFTTTKGYLTTESDYRNTDTTDTITDTINGPATTVTAVTDVNGKAAVTYDLVNHSGASDVIAEISSTAIPTYQRRVTFNINGSGSQAPRDPDPDPTPDTTTLTVSPTSLTGAPGSTQQLAIFASQTAQIGNPILGEFLNAGGSASPTSGTGTFTTTLTLPSTTGTYNLIVSIGATQRTVPVTVSTTAVGSDTQTDGTLQITTDLSGGQGESKTVTVVALNANGTRAAGVAVQLRVTPGGGTFSDASVTTGDTGTATTTFTRGNTVGSEYFITATATGYTGPAGGVRVTITGPQSATDTGTSGTSGTQPRTAGEADAIDVYDGNNQRGVLNAQLLEPLVVEVVDANDAPVSNERVTFRTTIGEGRFRPARPRTDASGFAETLFTPTSSGRIRIAASVAGVSSRAVFTITTGEPPASLTKASGDSQSGTPGTALANPFIVEVQDAEGEAVEGVRVTFSISAGGGSLSETSATTDADGRASTTLTLGRRAGVNSVEATVSGVDPVTFNTSVDAKILVAAANRPVMYWIASGDLYRLAGAKEAKIAENVNAAAIGGNKLYWTVQTGESAGTVHSANLDGTGATQLTKIQAVPIGIAVDTANSKLYWTNSRGRVQSAALNGSGIRNVVQNRAGATDIAIGGDSIYWVQNGTSIHRVPIQGQKVVADVATGLSGVGGIAVSATKVYWTETARTGGTINGADLDGTNFKTLKTIQAVPMGIAVDIAGSHLYWTNSIGRVQRANLNATRIQNVVDGLIAPGQLLIGGANTPATPTQPAKKPATTAKANYDVDGSGTVDNADVFLVALAVGTSNAKYDVNGDGTVNDKDIALVRDNRDTGAAAAPMVVGVKLTAEQVGRLQAQIDLLIAAGDRSPAALKTLVYLQQLIVTARPEKTQLLANYPNPFNPETWMPYELATDTDVTLTIYNAQGVVVRVLHLGQQAAGYYTDRERAAYWDGRNALGEQVASGIYFYQLQTDDMSTLRKMVILK